MVLIERMPTLYSLEKNGKTRVWDASVSSKNGKTIAVIEYGQLDGKKQQIIREYTQGKNIGKKNETTPEQQCLLETRKKWLDKKEKNNYSTELNGDVNQLKYFPMLAHKYDPEKSKIVFPCYVQPKLDGLRCIMYKDSTGVIRAQSRTGNYFETVEHIINQLKPILDQGIVLDGELYTDKIPFEQLAGLIKKKKITDLDTVQLIEYHVYDIINDKPYSERKKIINKLNVKKVDTYRVNSFTEVKEYFTQFIEEGFEGIMLRNKLGVYRCNYRSYDLQKYKEFIEDEYPIIGFKEGEGKDKGLVIWICETPEKRQFCVRPKGTVEYRKSLFKNGNKYIGKMLTVIYQELSKLNVPRFPVGKDIRENY